MRILMLTQYYPPETGAAAIRLQAMTRELIARGYDVDIVTARANYPTGRIFDGQGRRLVVQEQRDGATVRRVWIHAATGSGFGRLFGFASFAAMGMVGMFRFRRPDVVLVESPPLPAVLPALIHRLVRRSPNVLLLADLWPATAVELGLVSDGGASYRLLRRLERAVYATSWRISPVTRGQIETLKAEHRVGADRIAFLPNGVDTVLFHPHEHERSLARSKTPRVILFAGTMGYAQGLDTVIDAIQLVRQVHPDVTLLLVGGGSERHRLEQRVASERLAGIEFDGPLPIDEVAPMMRDCYAGITSLRRSKVLEGARPSKIFPIMASARPVIYSGDGEGARLIADAGAGVAAPAEDAAALAMCINELLDDPANADAMGCRGREYVEQNLSWGALIDDWLERLGPVPRRW